MIRGQRVREEQSEKLSCIGEFIVDVENRAHDNSLGRLQPRRKDVPHNLSTKKFSNRIIQAGMPQPLYYSPHVPFVLHLLIIAQIISHNPTFLFRSTAIGVRWCR